MMSKDLGVIMKLCAVYGAAARRGTALLVIAIFAAIGSQSIALAQVESAASSQQVKSGVGQAGLTAIPAALHAWQGFLKLAAKPDAVVTVDDLEGAFGKRAVDQGDYHRIPGIPIALLVNHDRVNRADHQNRSTVFVSFDFIDSLMIDRCIRSAQAISDLLAIGWTLHSHTPGEPPQGDIREAPPSDSPYGSYLLLKGDQGIIHLGYSERTSCATTLTMASDGLDLDRLSGSH